MTFLILEAVFCCFYIFYLLFMIYLAFYSNSERDKQKNYLKRMFAFGIPAVYFSGIIVGVSKARINPIYTFILNLILILGKSGLFAGFFIICIKLLFVNIKYF